MSEGTVITIANVQCKDCGKAPDLKPSKKNNYIGYFENEYGEQNVVIFDLHKKEGLFYCGDNSWDKPFKIDSNGIVQGLIMSPSEKEWYVVCQKRILEASA